MQTLTKTTSQEVFGRGHLELVVVENRFGRAIISLQGAQLLSYRRKRDDKQFLWLSDDAAFEAGRAIRGGVPICLPWFGPKDGKAQHGFARNLLWRHCNDGDHGKVKFELVARAEDPKFDFDWDFTATVEMSFTDQLQITLTILNESARTMPLSWALHSYLPVDDIETTVVSGLDQCEFVDNADQGRRSAQSGLIGFSGEVDRAYLHVGETQRIDGAFEVSSAEARSAVIWNPGSDLASRMADLSDYRGFVCLERGDVLDDARRLLPSQAFLASVIVRSL
ncbi:MAG: D-hexose-6-phosphate mutarotase [Cellvibrionaceae bacterium]